MPNVNPGPATSSIVNLQPVVGSFDNSGNVLQLYGANNVPLTLNGMSGITNGTDASAGQIGEYVSAIVVPTTVSLTTATTANMTSISLTAGDWDVQGGALFQTAASTSVTSVIAGISTTTNTLGADGTYARSTFAAVVPGAIEWQDQVSPVVRLSLSATTTVYLVAQSTFTVSTQTAGGYIRARRVR